MGSKQTPKSRIFYITADQPLNYLIPADWLNIFIILADWLNKNGSA
jgi:hypothetical protein